MHIEFNQKKKKKKTHQIKLNLPGNSQVKVSASGGDWRHGEWER